MMNAYSAATCRAIQIPRSSRPTKTTFKDREIAAPNVGTSKKNSNKK
jgi:hypothetical protein